MEIEANTKRHQLQAAIARLKTLRNERSTQARQLFRKRFGAARERLRTRILEDFKRTDWPRLQMLNEIFSRGYGLPVPALSVCGAGTEEVRFTKLLAYYFDAHNHHGLGGLLARAVFETEIDGGESLPFEHCEARAEVSLGASRMTNDKEVYNSLDLQLDVGEFKILIEQKIKSSEGNEQLPRYTKAILKLFDKNKIACFFLTPEGRMGSDDLWKPLSYHDLFRRLASVLDRHALSSIARYNLRALLWDLMLGPLAQERQWMIELQEQTQRVARDYRRYFDFRTWFAGYGMGREELRVLAKIIEG